MPAKNPNNNTHPSQTKKRPSTINRPSVRFWRDVTNDCPSVGGWRERLINCMSEWLADNPDGLTLMQFCSAYGISRPYLYELAQKYDDIGQGLQALKLVIADRRLVGCIQFKYNMQAALRGIGRLDPEMTEDAIADAKIKSLSAEVNKEKFELEAQLIMREEMEKFLKAPLTVLGKENYVNTLVTTKAKPQVSTEDTATE